MTITLFLEEFKALNARQVSLTNIIESIESKVDQDNRLPTKEEYEELKNSYFSLGQLQVDETYLWARAAAEDNRIPWYKPWKRIFRKK